MFLPLGIQKVLSKGVRQGRPFRNLTRKKQGLGIKTTSLRILMPTSPDCPKGKLSTTNDQLCLQFTNFTPNEFAC